MNCLKCGHNNPMTGGFCQKCGGKLDLTADEIRDSLIERARGESARGAEVYARQALTFAVVLLFVAVTLLVLSGGAPEAKPHTPSISSKATYLAPETKLETQIPKVLIPIEPRKKK